MDEGGVTKSVKRGSGNFYARESLCRNFVDQHLHEDIAALEGGDDA